MNLASLVDTHPADAPALHDTAGWHTWGEVRRRARAVAAGLDALDVHPGDRVAVVWPTSVDFVVAYLGVLACGGVAVPLNPNSPAAELERELAVVQPAVILAGGAAVDTAMAAASAATVIVPGGSPVSPTSWEALSGLAPVGPGEGTNGNGAEGQDGGGPLGALARGEDDPAVLLFTSGTAGAPKAAVLTHGNLAANLRQMLANPGEMFRPDDVGLAAVPLFHIFGLNVALGLALATGAGLVLEERFDPEESLRLARELGVTTLAGVPAMFDAWAAVAERAGAGADTLVALRRAVSGAAALAPEVAARFERFFHVPLWQGYGLTEASPAVATSLGTGRNRAGSVGRPLPEVEIRLVDGEGDDVLEGDPGEIWVRGPNVFAGYWRDAAATAAVLDAQGWLHTGDVGVIGEEGDLFVVDRQKDLVIVSGFNVFPAEVEKVAQAMPGVAEAVVVGRPDAETGEAVELVVVAEPGAAVTGDEVRAFCLARLARYKCPTTVRFVSELPRGLVGKALRRALRGEPV
ncbi:MAG TPA: AMP-binding protein [Acidimicrobiales bacterium]|nr:AMP-binding protein [Acidimicrobiales bacterium]